MACVADYARIDINFEDFITDTKIYDVNIFINVRRLSNLK